MFDRCRRILWTPVLELDPVWVRGRVNVMRAGMVEVRPEIVLEEIRSWLPLQSVPEQIDRPAIQILASLDDREHIATRQHWAVGPIQFGLVEFTSTVRVVVNRLHHCSYF